MQVAGSGSTPLQFAASLVATSQNYNTNTPIPISPPSLNSIAASPSSGNTITLTKTGVYIVQAWGRFFHDSQQQLVLLINGGAVGIGFNVQGGNLDPGAFALTSTPMLLTAGTTIGFRGFYSGADIGPAVFPDQGSAVLIVFIPTPTYRR